MGTVYKEIQLVQLIKDAENFKIKFARNVPFGGTLVMIKFVILLMIYVDNGNNLESVSNVIKGMW